MALASLFLILAPPAHAGDPYSCFKGFALTTPRTTAPLLAPLDGQLGWREKLILRWRLYSYLMGNIEESRFDINRGVKLYTAELQTRDDSLLHSLQKLHASSHLIDLGSGVFQFAVQLLRGDLKEVGGKLPNITGITMADLSAVSLEREPTLPRAKEIFKDPKLNALVGQYFEKIPIDKIVGRFGLADLVIDLYGIINYSANLGATTEKVARLMKPGADLWLRANSAIIHVGGEELSLIDFLVRSGLFETISMDERQRQGEAWAKRYKNQVAHLRRTTRTVTKINLVLKSFTAPEETGGAPGIEWTLITDDRTED